MRKIGVTVGSYDLCHSGHMLAFKEARENCDYLIVGLQVDPSVTDASYRGKKKNSPIMSLEERRVILSGIKYIDEIFIYTTEENLYEKLKNLEYDVHFIGSDWKDKPFTGHDLGRVVHFLERNHSFSTTELRERIYKAEKAKLEQK